MEQAPRPQVIVIDLRRHLAALARCSRCHRVGVNLLQMPCDRMRIIFPASRLGSLPILSCYQVERLRYAMRSRAASEIAPKMPIASENSFRCESKLRVWHECQQEERNKSDCVVAAMSAMRIPQGRSYHVNQSLWLVSLVQTLDFQAFVSVT